MVNCRNMLMWHRNDLTITENDIKKAEWVKKKLTCRLQKTAPGKMTRLKKIYQH